MSAGRTNTQARVSSFAASKPTLKNTFDTGVNFASRSPPPLPFAGSIEGVGQPSVAVQILNLAVAPAFRVGTDTGWRRVARRTKLVFGHHCLHHKGFKNKFRFLYRRRRCRVNSFGLERDAPACT